MRNKDTKLWLTEEEIELFENTSFFRAKQALTTHLIDILDNARAYYEDQLGNSAHILPAETLMNKGKISKGENYLGLPYLVLDYPASFKKEGVFTFRTMLWWGHQASITFHISGIHLDKLSENFPGLTGDKPEGEILICINKNQWEHHHEDTNYIPLRKFILEHESVKKHALENGFLKIMLKIPIHEIQELHLKGSAFILKVIKGLK